MQIELQQPSQVEIEEQQSGNTPQPTPTPPQITQRNGFTVATDTTVLDASSTPASLARRIGLGTVSGSPIPSAVSLHLNSCRDELVFFRSLPLPLFNVCVVSLCFAVLFSAFNPMQSFVTSLLGGSLGSMSLTICYGTVTAVVLIVPAVVHAIGEPVAMRLGAAGYCLFLVALLWPTPTVLLSCSVVLGCGSAMLWVAMGSYLTRCSTDADRARNLSIFWSSYQSSNVFGNIAAYTLFAHVAPTLLFECLSALAICGALVLLALKPLPERFFASTPRLQPELTHTLGGGERDSSATNTLSTTSTDDEHDEEGEEGADDTSSIEMSVMVQPCAGAPSTLVLHASEEVSLRPSPPLGLPRGVGTWSRRDSLSLLPVVATSSMRPPVVPLPVVLSAAPPSPWSLARDVLTLLFSWPMLCLCPLFFGSGITFAWWNGSFTLLLPIDSIGLVLCCTGVAEVAGGLLLGPFSERVGRTVTLSLGALIYVLGLCITATQLMRRDESSAERAAEEWIRVRMYAYVAAACFGLGDSAFNTQLYALLGERYPTQGASAFTAFNLLQNLGLAVGFYAPVHCPMQGPQGSTLQIWAQVVLVAAAAAGFTTCERHFERQNRRGGAYTYTQIAPMET